MKIIKWILAAITLLSTVLMLFIFPDTIPVHFDINGIADRWGSKFEMLVLPVMAIITMIMFLIIHTITFFVSHSNHLPYKLYQKKENNNMFSL